MREIKFRFYDDKVSKRMIYQDPIERMDRIFVKWEFTPKPSQLMQYTGLKDKNGKEIYEGDIYKYIIQVHYGVKHSEFECKDVVRYENGAFWVGDHLLIDALENDDEAEIIGNIFDNPDLVGESYV